MNIVFVHLGRENLGIEYISSVLEKAGHKTYLAYDAGLFGSEDNVFYLPFLERLFSQKEKVIATIEKLAPDLVAFSVYSSTYRWACEIARLIKERREAKIVFGGIHPTLVPELVINNRFVDFVIEGEGEYALLDLVKAISLRKTRYDIENLWYKEKGRVLRNRIRPPIEDLDLLPLPNKELFKHHINYRDDYMIMTSRGCLFNCSYCCESFMNKLYHSKFFRRRSVDSVIEELSIMKERYGFREVMFFDALFFTDKKWLRGLLKRYKQEIAVPFKCLGKSVYFDEEVAGLLKESGCYCVDFGIQTLNQALKRDLLNRHESNQGIKQAFKFCDKIGLRYDVDHMFGLPGECEEDHLYAARIYSQLRYLNRIKCFQLTYFPKMPILNRAKELGCLDEQDIANIEKGQVGDFFHRPSCKDKAMADKNNNFKIFYKFLSLFPDFSVRYILKNKLYRSFRFIPHFVVIFLQMLVALRGRDYRYLFYLKYYLLRIRMSFKR